MWYCVTSSVGDLTYHEILAFWFSDSVCEHWFNATPALDSDINDRFFSVYQDAVMGRFADWENTADGCVALVIVLDQFPLNMFRGKAESFASEKMSRAVANRAIEKGFDLALDDQYKIFLYMPFMHSEDLRDQDSAVDLFMAAGLTENVTFAKHHRAIIKQFGRFPHRNAALGRSSTDVEQTYLASGAAFLG